LSNDRASENRWKQSSSLLARLIDFQRFPVAAASKEACSVKKGKVLLADKHQGLLAGVRTLLESTFEKVFMVADETSLLEAAEKIMPDLIIADLSLPVTKEINIARRLKKLFPNTKLIILSVHDEQAAINECTEAGAAGFVLKRSAVIDLIPAIEAVMQGSKYISQPSGYVLRKPPHQNASNG
jgi:DNA-binding NarL/FixJ family response regulator